MGIPCVRPQSDMMCYMLDRCDLGLRRSRGVGEERESLSPYKGHEYQASSTLALKFAYTRGLCKRYGWVTHTHIDENPVIRGHDLCFDKTCQWQTRLEMWSGRRKTVRNYDRTDVMSCYKKLSADWARVKLSSLCGCVRCVCYRSGHVDTSEDNPGVRKGEPALQCRRQICAPDSSSLKPGSGATEGVLD